MRLPAAAPHRDEWFPLAKAKFIEGCAELQAGIFLSGKAGRAQPARSGGPLRGLAVLGQPEDGAVGEADLTGLEGSGEFGHKTYGLGVICRGDRPALSPAVL